MYATGSQIKFTTLMLKSSLCDYSGANILFKRTKTVPNTAAVCADPNARNQKKIFLKGDLSTDCISKINNTETDHPKYIDVVI